MSAGVDRWIGWTIVAGVGVGADRPDVSYLHMHDLVARHRQPGWVRRARALLVDGMIVAASSTLLANSRTGRRVTRSHPSSLPRQTC